MSIIVSGIVKDGMIVPSSPLPEGARVEILFEDSQPEIPGELQAEFKAWDRSSADALALVERLAVEGDPDETR